MNSIRISAGAALLVSLAALSTAHASTLSVRIIGGQPDDSQPWVAGLHAFDTTTSEYGVYPFCGGSLIAPQWVLTAAHCVADADRATALYSASEILVRIDSPDLFAGDGAPLPPAHTVDRVIFHADYGPSQENDLALLRLSTPVTTVPANLAGAPQLSLLNSGYATSDLVQALGWGIQDDSPFDPNDAIHQTQSDTLRAVRLDFLPWALDACRYAYGGLPSSVVCARESDPAKTEADDSADPTPADPNGEDACFGDSGGPLVLPANTRVGDTRVSDSWLIGTTSSGSETCDSRTSPGVYTSVLSFVRWLEDRTRDGGSAIVDLEGSWRAPDPVASVTGTVEVEGVIENRSLANAAEEITVRFQPPAGATLVVADSGAFTCDTGGVCSLAALGAGEQASVRLNITGHYAADTEAPARLSVDSLEHDYRAPNNESSVGLVFTNAPWLDLALRKAGTYLVDISLANLGGSTASDPVLAVTLAPDSRFRAADADGSTISCTPDGSRYLCPLAPLAADEQRVIRLEVLDTGRVTLSTSLSASGAYRTDSASLTLSPLDPYAALAEGGGGASWVWLLSGALYLRCRSRRRY